MKHLKFNIFAVIAVCVLSAVKGDCIDGFKWSIPGHVPTGLCCSNKCREENIEACCACNSYKESTNRLINILHVEYVGVKGRAVFYSPKMENNAKYKVIHQNGYLQEIPHNLCKFPGIVELLLDNNHIKGISGVACLEHLDTISLIGNELTFIKNDTFIGLSHLRQINLRNNKIAMLDPGTFSDVSLSVLKVRLDENQLKTVDISNLVLDKLFCYLDYADNGLNEITNDIGFTLDHKLQYELGGRIRMQNNDLTNFDFTVLGIIDMRLLGKIIQNYWVSLGGTKLSCDCKMEPFLEVIDLMLIRESFDSANIICEYPPSLQNQSIIKLVNDRMLDLFICDTDRNCPKECHCVSQPWRRRILVNCSSVGLTQMPLILPDFDKLPHKQMLEIHLDGNRITKLEKRSYLRRTSKLYLSYNNLLSINPKVFEDLQEISILDLSNNPNLKKLPKTIELLKPCVFDFSNLYVVCDCSNLWISEWLNRYNLKNCARAAELKCRTSKGYAKATEVDSSYLDCYDETALTVTTIVTAIMLVFICGSSMFFAIRYEMYIIYRTVFNRGNKAEVRPEKEFDVYISCSDHCSVLNRWVKDYLITFLELSGYSVCFPGRDFALGCVRSEEILRNVSKCRNILLLLTEYHFHEDSPWGRIEWNTAWELFKDHGINIVIINYDQLRMSDIHDRRIKAFYRLNMQIDFTNQDMNLFQDIVLQLGTKLSKNNEIKAWVPNLNLRSSASFSRPFNL